MVRTALVVLLVIGLNSCRTRVYQNEFEDQTMTYLKSNMEFLASDELQGREASTFGGYAAGQFITNQLKKYGLEPDGEEGYFQNFKLHSVIYNGSRITLESDKETDSLHYLQDYYIYTNGDSIKKSPIIFAGFGIVDTANDINDYKNINVEGKTVLVLRGIPEGYKGSKRAAWTRSKSRAAQKLGAVGCIVIFSSKTMQSWGDEIQSAKKEKIGRIRDRKNINTIILDSLTTKNVFDMPARSYAEVRKALEDGLIENGTVLKQTVTWQLKENRTERIARNIIGKLKGSDPALEKEYIIIGAHYDHVGIKNGQIHNGADDNASGTTANLECARLLASEKNNKRPILFCFWDAEEKGLLGSEHYANSHQNISEIVVNINLDMIGREHEDTLAVIGAGKLSSEFFHMVENINTKTSDFVFDYVYDDENHPENLYRRSDHWSFAKKGVPAVFFFDDEDTDYHTAFDDAHKINYLKLKKVVDLASQLALNVANLEHRLVVDNANISGLDLKK